LVPRDGSFIGEKADALVTDVAGGVDVSIET
jgi:hypothetical protein